MLVVGWRVISILPGAYEVRQINAEVKRLIDDTEAFNIYCSPRDQLG